MQTDMADEHCTGVGGPACILYDSGSYVGKSAAGASSFVCKTLKFVAKSYPEDPETVWSHLKDWSQGKDDVNTDDGYEGVVQFIINLGGEIETQGDRQKVEYKDCQEKLNGHETTRDTVKEELDEHDRRVAEETRVLADEEATEAELEKRKVAAEAVKLGAQNKYEDAKRAFQTSMGFLLDVLAAVDSAQAYLTSRYQAGLMSSPAIADAVTAGLYQAKVTKNAEAKITEMVAKKEKTIDVTQYTVHEKWNSIVGLLASLKRKYEADKTARNAEFTDGPAKYFHDVIAAKEQEIMTLVADISDVAGRIADLKASIQGHQGDIETKTHTFKVQEAFVEKFQSACADKMARYDTDRNTAEKEQEALKQAYTMVFSFNKAFKAKTRRYARKMWDDKRVLPDSDFIDKPSGYLGDFNINGDGNSMFKEFTNSEGKLDGMSMDDLIKYNWPNKPLYDEHGNMDARVAATEQGDWKYE